MSARLLFVPLALALTGAISFSIVEAEEGVLPPIAGVPTESPGLAVADRPTVAGVSVPALAPVVPAGGSYVRILFAGDTHFIWGVKDLQKREGQNAPVAGIRDLFQGADYRVLNLETVMAAEGRTLNHKSYVFRSDPGNLGVLKGLGVEGLFLANNHTYDLGLEGVQQTLDELRQAALSSAGIGKTEVDAVRPWISEVRGVRVAFFSLNLIGRQELFAKGERGGTASPGPLFFDELRKARQQAHYVVVGVHWGNEYEIFPNAEQQALGRRLIREGADAVIGHHPHVPQGVEYYAGKPIVYSLGNFLFGSANYQQTHNLIAVLRIDTTTHRSLGVELYPVTGKYRQGGYAVSVVGDDERLPFWQEIFLLNRKLNSRQKMTLEGGMSRMLLLP